MTFKKQDKTAMLIHGTTDTDEYFGEEYPSLSNSHWFPWLQKQLSMNGYLTQTPEMPNAYSPVYSDWKKTFEQFSVNSDSILVGHSCGGGFLLRWLSENDVKVDKVVLVAPWLDPKKEKCPDFFDFEINRNLTTRTNLSLFSSDNDSESMLETARIVQKHLPEIHLKLFKNYGHFCFSDMKTQEFPELRDLLLC